MAGGMVEVVQEIITRSKRAALLEMRHHGGAHISSGPEDAELANGALIDGEFVEYCLFDDDQTGFDSEEAGFA